MIRGRAIASVGRTCGPTHCTHVIVKVAIKYVYTNEGSKPEVLSRIAQTTAALSRLKIMWRDKNISLASTVKLMQMLILSTFMPVRAGPWQQKSREESKPLRMRCYRRLLNISYKDHVTNDEVRNRIQNATGEHDDLLTMVLTFFPNQHPNAGRVVRKWLVVK